MSVWCFFLVVVSTYASGPKEIHRVALDCQYDVMESVRNIHQCYNLCVAHCTCVSFNYDVVTRTCQLFSQTSGGNLIEKRNSVYVELQQDLTSAGHCNQRTCNDNEVCVRTENTKHICLSSGSGVDCAVPSNISGAEVTYSSTRFPSVATYTCKSGYNYVSGSNSSTCQASGLWSDSELICEGSGVDCAVPSNISGAEVTYSSTRFPSVATYTCKSGYNYVSGSNSSTCQASGLWSDSELICEGVDCAVPSNISGAEVTYSSTRFPSVATYTCKSEYNYVSGSNSSTCQASGLWSDPELICTGCGVPNNMTGALLNYSSTTPSSVATYTCEHNNIPFYTATSTCLENGQWSKADINCTECFFVKNATVVYAGYKRTTITGEVCQRWNTTTPHGHSLNDAHLYPDATVDEADNFCRDPDGEGFPWCFLLNPHIRFQSCGIPPCQKYEECYSYITDRDGDRRGVYSGNKSTTVDGIVCQRWDSQTPHDHKNINPIPFATANLSYVENLCRDPDMSGYPWCYTMDEQKRYDSCGVELCKT